MDVLHAGAVEKDTTIPGEKMYLVRLAVEGRHLRAFVEDMSFVENHLRHVNDDRICTQGFILGNQSAIAELLEHTKEPTINADMYLNFG